MKKLLSILIIITLTLSACACSHAARLPNAGEKNWGSILNEFLLVAHNTDGTLTPNSVSLTNKSGGAVAQYDVVVVGTAFDNSFNTTTTAGNVNVVGVTQEAIADNTAGDILPPSALTTVNIKAGVTIVRGDYLITSTVAGKADRSAAYTDGAFARALTGGTGTVTAILINQSENYAASRTLTGNWTFTPSSGNTIFSAGNVGIGVASPAANLHIYEATTDVAFQIQRASNVGNAVIKFQTNTTDDWMVGLRNDSTSDFRIYNYGTSSDVFSILRVNGYVGIGTTSPGTKLDVRGSASGSLSVLNLVNTNQAGTNDTSSIIFQLGRTADSVLQTGGRIAVIKEQQWTGTTGTVDAAMAFYTIQDESTTERMRITSGGNVGIGTNNPAAKLDINGTMAISSTTKVTNLNADLFDGYNSGNGTGAIPISNGTVNTNLNADLLDGYTASNASASIPISNGTVNSNLNADMLDGRHADALFGTWDTRTVGTTYQAASDLIVIATATSGSGGSCRIYGETDSAATPTTRVADNSIPDVAGKVGIASVTFPVKKNHYYQTGGTGASYYMYILPIGN